MTSQERQYYTNFLPKQEMLLALKNCSKEFLHSFLDEFINSQAGMRITIADGYGYINHVANLNSWPDFVRKIFLQCFFVSEASVKGSGNIAVYFLAKRILNLEVSFNEESKRADALSSFQSLSKFIDNNIYEFIRQVIEYTGINGKVSIKETKSSIPTIELQACHDFKLGIAPGFTSNSENRDASKIALYDGTIENIGVVDRLFNECHEKNVTCVLIARSFAPDVLSTLNSNYHRKTLDIIPVVVEDKIENINIMQDIAACTGTKLINAESGIRLSNISVEEFCSVHGLKVTSQSLRFDEVPVMKEAIEKRIKKILLKIEKAAWNDDMSKEDIEVVYNGRLKSLSSNSVTLWLPENHGIVDYVNGVLRFSISHMAAFAHAGYITTDEFDESRIGSRLPANIADIANITSSKMHEAICNSGGCVVIQ